MVVLALAAAGEETSSAMFSTPLSELGGCGVLVMAFAMVVLVASGVA